MVLKEEISEGFSEPVAEFRPSKQVILFVKAALRKVLASVNFLESGGLMTREMDFFKEDSVIWCSSLQSWMVPRCFSTRLEFPDLTKRSESFSDSDMAVFRVWRRKTRVFGLMFMERLSFSESKQEWGNGVELQKLLMDERWNCETVVELGRECVVVERKREERW